MAVCLLWREHDCLFAAGLTFCLQRVHTTVVQSLKQETVCFSDTQ